MEYKTLNLKEFMPTVEQALAMIEIELKICKKEGIKVLKIIHGYGSSGVGGDIKKALPNWAKLAKRKKLFQEFVKGEEWNGTSEIIKEIKELCPEILGDFQLYGTNAGVSIILI